MTDQDARPGWVDDDGLWWCVPGGAAVIRPEWFNILLGVMSAADRVAALRQAGLAVEADERASTGWISARHPSGLWLAGESSLLTAALCYWEDWDTEDARQRVAFDRAYGAVRAVGMAALGEPALQAGIATSSRTNGAPGGSGTWCWPSTRPPATCSSVCPSRWTRAATLPRPRWSPHRRSSAGCGAIGDERGLEPALDDLAERVPW
jgi:hypothetical protein